ncbi:DUF1489 domain-containing protein [Acetobacter sp. TBRC 12305]|uniref:DUF1489 domain-containing protein n=1 Tax=Acetobacter garciniae TaxID=2817435 RepID=A0A939HNW9_9PROT|nr:DUF1489 domain-containing protein [Acetobacter garciniae]MBO1325188.1 DUF1489 domain-containing protein [Acetobacter garciniae]MBX0344841.1 DUF1489 domain-containing protein [Acetobacter garciniae]
MLNLIKLVVGVASLEDLVARQKLAHNTRQIDGHAERLPVVHTRAFPRQAETLLAGGSLYRVIGGLILCRQELRDIRTETREDGTNGTLLLLSPRIIPVEPRPMRPFQGWRYLNAADAPPDLTHAPTTAPLPTPLLKALTQLGL